MLFSRDCLWLLQVLLEPALQGGPWNVEQITARIAPRELNTAAAPATAGSKEDPVDEFDVQPAVRSPVRPAGIAACVLEVRPVCVCS